VAVVFWLFTDFVKRFQAYIMQSSFVSTVIKLAIGSLLLGMLLAAFSISPQELLENLGGTVVGIFNVLASMLEWAVQYILLGAVVVIPIWLVLYAWRKFRGK
tara:strand:- start:166 stop:471 length:306 start_codon:yes stop_codon:yes gene_type:complete